MAALPAKAVLALHQQWCGQFSAPGADAQAILRTAFQGCRLALQALQSELAAMRYPVDPMLPASTEVQARVSRLEHAMGASVPRPLKLFWEEVGGVSLVALGGYEHVDFWDAQGLHSECCDGLYVEPLNEESEHYFLSEWEYAQEDPQDFYFSLSPDDCHKDNVSGGASYGVRPSRAQDEVLTPWLGYEGSLDELEWGQPFDLVAYLRWSVLVHAGFPGFGDSPAFQPIRDRLLRQVKVF